MGNNIRYQFREVHHITQAVLADEVTKRCREDGSGYSVNVPFLSTLLDKAVRGSALNIGKEQTVYNHLLDILEELENGKTWS